MQSYFNRRLCFSTTGANQRTHVQFIAKSVKTAQQNQHKFTLILLHIISVYHFEFFGRLVEKLRPIQLPELKEKQAKKMTKMDFPAVHFQNAISKTFLQKQVLGIKTHAFFK